MQTFGPFRPAADLSEICASQDPWLVPGIIPESSVVVLASSPKVGKTCFATALARSVALGESFLGQPVRQSPVLWCAHEEAPQERIHLHEGLTVEDPFFIAYISDLPPLPHRIGKPDRFGRRNMRDFEPPFIFEHAIEAKAKLIVIDCLHAAVEGSCLADNSSARAIMSVLRTWCHYLGISVLLLHHLTKSSSRGHEPERFADSSQILAAASCHFFMDRLEDGETASRVVLQGKGRHPAPYARMELISTGPLDYTLAAEANPRPRRLKVSDRVHGLLEAGWCLTAAEIAHRLDLNPATVRYALARLQESGDIKVGEKMKRAPRYEINEGPNLYCEEKSAA